jgi:hypothetical protein
LDYQGLQAYYRDLKFDFGKAEEAGLSAFFRILGEIGEISQVPSLEMFSSMASVA